MYDRSDRRMCASMIEPGEIGPALVREAPHGNVMIVRHAQSAANAGERTSDPAVIPITDLGRSQAQCVSTLLREPPDVIVVSRYIRTVQTAEAVTSRFPNISVEEWPVQEFTYLDQALCAGTTSSEREVLVDAYWKALDPQLRNGRGCESFSDFVHRASDPFLRPFGRPFSGHFGMSPHARRYADRVASTVRLRLPKTPPAALIAADALRCQAAPALLESACYSGS
jgi:hypothetical protein